MKVKVEVSLKDGVLDPQAKTIYNAIHSLKFDCVKDVKMIKTIILDIDAKSANEALAQAKEISEKLLANVVIESYKLELLP